jgi:hypothetical protein
MNARFGAAIVAAVVALGLAACTGASRSHASPGTTTTTASQQRAPSLRLSASSGSVGTRIAITATGCPAVDRQPKSVFWHNAYNLAHPKAAVARGLVALARRQVSTDRVESSYVVTRADAPGQSLIDVECGGSLGNAVGNFMVMGGLFTCPKAALVRATGNPRAEATLAAVRFVRTNRHQNHWVMTSVYRVGQHANGIYGEIFAAQVPYCGQALTHASWVVELYTPSMHHIGDSVSIAEVVVAPFTNGWKVWGEYH